MPSSNKTIAKNAFYLYVRMFVLLLVGLYTSRVNLHSLGVEGYGVYNVVAGFVIMFGALTGALGNAISRFIQVELGKNNNERLELVFSTSVTIQVVVSIIMAVLIEALGLWFIYNKMHIPEGSLNAAIWLLQFSIISFVINLLYVPYYSCIIAHERMSAFAKISLLEAILKLIIAYIVAYSPFNKLIAFGALLMFNQLLIQAIYIGYCKRHFTECKVSFTYDKTLIKEMSGFIGWNMFSHGASVLNVQGVNMVMNVFFGVIVNASRAIETQVSNAVQQFISSFTTALIPPITKSYAAGDKEVAYNLIYKGDRYSYYLMLLLSLPIILEADTILTIWLKTPPDYASLFVSWTLAASLVRTLGCNTIFAIIMADGNIRNFQLSAAFIAVLPLPLSWAAFEFGAPVETAYIIYFLTQVLLTVVRLLYAQSITGLPARNYCTKVLGPVLLVTFISIIIPMGMKFILTNSFISGLYNIFVTLMTTLLSIAFVGMKKAERQALMKSAYSFIHK